SATPSACGSRARGWTASAKTSGKSMASSTLAFPRSANCGTANEVHPRLLGGLQVARTRGGHAEGIAAARRVHQRPAGVNRPGRLPGRDDTLLDACRAAEPHHPGPGRTSLHRPDEQPATAAPAAFPAPACLRYFFVTAGRCLRLPVRRAGGA